MKKAVDFFLDRSLLVHLLTLSILLIGGFFAYNLRKEIFPPIDFDIITITAFYPGSSAEDVENLVTIPAERAIKGVAGFKRVNSVSLEGVSRIIIEVDQDYDLKEVYEDVQDALDTVRDFPEEVEDPTVVRLSNNEHRKIISVVLTGGDYGNLRVAAKELQKRLELLSQVKRVDFEGYLVDEVRIEIFPEKLNFYELTVGEVRRAVRERNLNLPAGRLDTPGGNIVIRTVSELRTTREIGEVVIRSNASGENVKVSDVAKVLRVPANSDIRQRSNSKRAIFLNVLTKTKSDILQSTDKIKQVTERFFAKGGRGVSYQVNHHYADSLAYWVKRRLNVLIDNGSMGFILVFICLLAFLNFRASVITSIGAPIAFMTSFIAMAFFDVSINLISMFSLIMVLGMLVDDSIIVAEYYFQKLEQGFSPKEAARQAAHETIAPILATIFTTMVAFGSFFFMGGTMGKFVRTIPQVVIICLAASIIECYFILPSHLADFVRLDKNRNKKPWYHKVTDLYRRFLTKAIKMHWLIVGSFLAMFIGSLFLAKTMRFELFPGDDVRTVFLQIKGTPGTPLEKTDNIMKQMEKIAEQGMSKNELEQTKSNVGVVFERNRNKSGTHYASLTIYLTPPNDRKRSTDEIVSALAGKIKPLVEKEGYTLITNKKRGGPPRGKPVDIEITGDDLDDLFSAAQKIEAKLRKVKGVTTTEIDFENQKRQLAVKIKDREARRLGVSAEDVALELRRTFSREWFSKIKEQEDDVEIKIYLDEKSLSKIDIVNSLYVVNKMGQRIPMSRIVEVEERPSAFVIRRKNRRRVISITADIDFRVTTPTAIARSFDQEVNKILQKHPGISKYFGGENEDTKDSMKNLTNALKIATVCIFLILVIMFGSISQSIMVMSTILLGFIGVVLTFKIAGKPLSFMSLLGTIALVGVVINDSIVLVNFINKIKKVEKNLYKAVIKASVSRFRPVILTTVTTVAGLLFLAHPTLARIISFGINKDSDPFLQPMAMSFAWGLAFASTITLIFIPSFYIVIEKSKMFIVAKWRKASF